MINKKETVNKIVTYVKNNKALQKDIISSKDLTQAEKDLNIDKYYIMLYIRTKNKSLVYSVL